MKFNVIRITAVLFRYQMFSFQLSNAIIYYHQILKTKRSKKITWYNRFVLSLFLEFSILLLFYTHHLTKCIFMLVNPRLNPPNSCLGLSSSKLMSSNSFDSFIHFYQAQLIYRSCYYRICFWNSNDRTSNFLILSFYEFINDSQLSC